MAHRTPRRVCVALALAVLAGAGCGATQLEQAQVESKTSDKPLVIMATASWCGPCTYFKKRVLPTAEVQAALGDVRFVMLDEADNGSTLRRLGVRSYPTFLVVTPDNKVVAGLRGATSSAVFVDFLRWGTPMYFSEPALEARLRDHPGRRIFVYAARYYALHGDLPKAQTYYDRAYASLRDDDADAKATLGWEIALVGSVGQGVSVVAAKAAALVGTFPDSLETRPALEFALLSGTLPPAQQQGIADRALVVFADEPATLNGLVYTFIAAGLPDHALRAGQRQVELLPEDANAYDTLGEAHNALRDEQSAVAAADTAIRLATASDSRTTYKANRKRYQAGEPSPSIAQAHKQFTALARRYGLRP